MTSEVQYKTPFERRVAAFQTPKNDINALILDYLTMEGYPNAAAKFANEANITPLQEDESIRARQEIQHSIHGGNIQAAIESLNELNPEILDEDKALHFSLLRLQLIELIRSSNSSGGDIGPAVQFATEQLGPRAPTNPQFLEDLERTMALILFPADTLDPQLRALLDPALRVHAADSVNKAILQRQSSRREAAIRQLVRMRSWAEEQARTTIASLELPVRIDIGLTGDHYEGQQSTAGSNGHDITMTGWDGK